MYRERWTKLFEGLAAIPPKQYQFTTWGKDRESYMAVCPDLNICTTVGCTVGWLPTIFPGWWTWKHDTPVLKNGFGIPSSQFAVFFGIEGNAELSITLIYQSHSTYTKGRRVKGIPYNVVPKGWIRNAKRILKAHEIEVE